MAKDRKAAIAALEAAKEPLSFLKKSLKKQKDDIDNQLTAVNAAITANDAKIAEINEAIQVLKDQP